jgi:hypothetical protein
MITIDFLKQQNGIIEYIKERYKEYLPEGLPEPNDYTTSFLNLDQYKNDTTIFINFGDYTFERKTNESELQETELVIYIVVRNETPDALRTRMLGYTTAFYQMFDDCGQDFDGLVDYGKINEITPYEYVEGTKNIKLAEITLALRNEI